MRMPHLDTRHIAWRSTSVVLTPIARVEAVKKKKHFPLGTLQPTQPLSNTHPAAMEIEASNNHNKGSKSSKGSK